MTAPLDSIDHVVMVMLENRSFDHMLGFLYTDEGNKSPAGDAFEGLTGDESNPDSKGMQHKVYRIKSTTPHAYLMPGADPGEGFPATNDQLYGTETPAAGAAATNQGFVVNYEQAIVDNKRRGWYVVPNTAAPMIMGCFDPAALPVLSALARGYAVCDHWYSSVPTETMPNRAFALAGTSQGHLDDTVKSYTTASVFGRLDDVKQSWKIYGYTQSPLTRHDFPDVSAAPDANFGHFKDFQSDAAAGTLPAFAFLEPSWGSTGNSQHPNYDVALGEQFLLDVYRAVRSSPLWARTLLVITYDEHGGLYDHVAPPSGATPPGDSLGELGFGFDRFGVRVPTVLVSPLITAGSVFRAPRGAPPFDHTSVLATLRERFGIAALTARDAAAAHVGAVLSRTTPRTDDPLDGVTAPPPTKLPKALAEAPSHLQLVQADLAAALVGADRTDGVPPPGLSTGAQVEAYIRDRVGQWAQRRRAVAPVDPR